MRFSHFSFYNKVLANLPMLLLLAIISPVSIAKKPEFPPPPEARVELVGDNMEVNGILTEIRSFHTRQSLEDVAKFYRKEWERGEEGRTPGYTETEAMVPWTLITRIEDGYLMTAQFQDADDGGTWGYLAISPLPDKDAKKVELGTGATMMNGSAVIREMKYDDPGKQARTLLLSNNNSVNSNLDFYRNHFRSKGWTVESDYQLAAGVMHSLVFKTMRKRTNIMLIGDNHETRIVINEEVNALF